MKIGYARVSTDAWLPISSAPRDGSLVLCWSAKWESPAFLVWKTNHRIPGRGAYFGDPREWDDYNLAGLTDDPAPATHWIPLPAFPEGR